jgi:hypothetical protein
MVPRKLNDVVQLSKIRMREGLRRKLVRQAEYNDTTLNGEIVDRLEISFNRDAERERDSTIINMLVGGYPGNKVNTALLRQIVSMLQANPEWYQTKPGIDDMEERIIYSIHHASNPLWMPPDEEEDEK